MIACYDRQLTMACQTNMSQAEKNRKMLRESPIKNALNTIPGMVSHKSDI